MEGATLSEARRLHRQIYEALGGHSCLFGLFTSRNGSRSRLRNIPNLTSSSSDAITYGGSLKGKRALKATLLLKTATGVSESGWTGEFGFLNSQPAVYPATVLTTRTNEIPGGRELGECQELVGMQSAVTNIQVLQDGSSGVGVRKSVGLLL